MTFFSVIIPIYNAEKYLHDSLGSLESQDFKDVEFICILDGPTDNSESICREYESSDDRFTVIKKRNSGPASARNAGLAIASGKYTLFVDSDDLLKPTALSQLFKILSKKNPDLLIHGADAIVEGGKCPAWIKDNISVVDKRVKKFDEEKIFTERGCTPFLWMHVVKTSIIKDNNIVFNEKMMIGEDQLFQIDYLRNVRDVVFIEEKLYTYRVGRPDSIMSNYYNNHYEKLVNHIILSSEAGNLVDIKDDKVNQLYAEWALDLIFWEFTELLYRDQKRVIGDINRIMQNITKHTYENTDIVHKMMILQLSSIMKYDDSEVAIINKMKEIEMQYSNEVNNKMSSLTYRLYKKIKNAKLPVN